MGDELEQPNDETDFEKRYISTSENTETPDATKIVLSDDAYAIGELLEKIFIQLVRGNRNG